MGQIRFVGTGETRGLFLSGVQEKLSHTWYLSLFSFCTVLENNIFLLVASACYLVFKVVAKLTYLVAIIGGHACNSIVTAHCQIYNQTKFHLVKSLIMPLTIRNCVLSYKKKNCFSKIGLFLQEITFRTEFPGSNFLLPTFLTGGKWDFQVTNLLLATVNFEPCGRPSFACPKINILRNILALYPLFTDVLVRCYNRIILSQTLISQRALSNRRI